MKLNELIAKHLTGQTIVGVTIGTAGTFGGEGDASITLTLSLGGKVSFGAWDDGGGGVGTLTPNGSEVGVDFGGSIADADMDEDDELVLSVISRLESEVADRGFAERLRQLGGAVNMDVAFTRVTTNKHTHEEEEQRRSFAHGNVSLSNPDVTRDVVDRAADEMEMSAPAPASTLPSEISSDMAVADDMTRALAPKPNKAPRKLADDPVLLALAGDVLRRAEGRPSWSTSNLPGQDVGRVRAVLAAIDAYLEEK